MVGKYRWHGGNETSTFRVYQYLRRKVCFVTSEFHLFCTDSLGLSPQSPSIARALSLKIFQLGFVIYLEEKGREVAHASYCAVPDFEVNNVTHLFCLSFPVFLSLLTGRGYIKNPFLII